MSFITYFCDHKLSLSGRSSKGIDLLIKSREDNILTDVRLRGKQAIKLSLTFWINLNDIGAIFIILEYIGRSKGKEDYLNMIISSDLQLKCLQ
jgi:hypothetical protein